MASDACPPGPRGLVALLAVALALSGCAGDPEPSGGTANASADGEPGQPADPAPNATARTGIAAAAGAEPGNATAEGAHWALLELNLSGEEAALAGFDWPVPDGAVQVDGDGGERAVAIEVAPVTVANVSDRDAGEVAVTDWFVAVFREEGGRAVLQALTAAETQTVEVVTLTDSRERTERASFQPVNLTVSGPELEAGDRLSLVVGAKSREPTSMGFGVRAAAQGEASRDFDGFRDRVGNRSPVAPEPVGTGTGFDFAEYGELNVGLTQGVRFATGTVEVRRQVPEPGQPAASTRAAELAFESRFDEGWSYLEGGYFTNSGAARWAVDHEVRGRSVAAEGALGPPGVPAPAQSAVDGALGDPFWRVYGGGEGATSTSFQVEALSANRFEFFGQFGLDLGATVEELVGVPSESVAEARSGVAGDLATPLGDLAEDLEAWGPDGFAAGADLVRAPHPSSPTSSIDSR